MDISSADEPLKTTGVPLDSEFQGKALATILRIDDIMSSISDLGVLLRLITTEAEKLADAEASSLLLFDPATNDLHFNVAINEDEKVSRVIQTIRVPMGDGSIAGYSAAHREPVNVQDVYSDSRFFKQSDEESSFKTRNILALPLLRKDKLIGVLEVLNKREGQAFTDEDVRILEVLAHQAAIAIENAQLFEANLKAERLAAIGQAVAGLAHYVKNIVTGMKGSTILVETAINEKSYDMLPRAWEILKRSSDKVANLVQDMLTYSKDRKPELAPVQINQIVTEVAELYRERARERNTTIETRLGEGLPSILVDETGMHHILTNFVGNAIDAIADHKRTSTEPGCIILSTEHRAASGEFVMTIQDNGCGIEQERIQKIWDPFVSDKGSRGTGLGLAVTRKIIQEHFGRVEAESRVGVGTTFRVFFPIARLEQAFIDSLKPPE